MNKPFKTILIVAIAVFGVVFLLPYPAYANDNLVIEVWDGSNFVPLDHNPLFQQANFLPGGSASGLIRVTNNSNTSQRIATEAINVSDPDRLGDVLSLEIKEGATPHFNNALSKFFTEGEVYLSDLAGNGGQTQYDFIVTFFSGAQNTFQGKSLSFDILIGFQGEEGGILPGAGTGAGGVLPPGLTIPSESVRITAVEEISVIITWQTNYFSTSQVIYAAEGEAHILDLTDTTGTPPKYGYARTTPEYDNSPKVTFHQVTLTGLTPGTTYYYRTVSHASPATISREYSFVTLGVAPEEEEVEEVVEEEEEEVPPEEVPEEEEFVPEVTPGEEVIVPEGEEVEEEVEEEIKPEEEIEEAVEEEITEEEEERVTFGANMAAAIGNIINSTFLFGFSIFLLAILAGLLLKEARFQYLAIRKRRRRE